MSESKIKVLVAEDEVHLGQILSTLGGRGYAVMRADGGRRSMPSRGKPTMLRSRTSYAELDGLEVLKQVRSDAKSTRSSSSPAAARSRQPSARKSWAYIMAAVPHGGNRRTRAPCVGETAARARACCSSHNWSAREAREIVTVCTSGGARVVAQWRRAIHQC